MSEYSEYVKSKMSHTFQDIINAALKTPKDANYGVSEGVHTVPQGEIGQDWAIKTVRKKRPSYGGITSTDLPDDNHVIMGFGGLFTFDLAVASNPPPAGVLLCDINSDQGMFWDAFLELVKRCKTAKALQNSFSLMSGEIEGAEFRKSPSRDFFGKEKLQWIYDEKKYQKIRQMVLDGKVANITLDVLDSDRYEKLKDTFAANNFFVSTLYLSDIRAWLPTEENPRDYWREIKTAASDVHEKFVRNQLSLCNDNTLILSAEPYPNTPGFPIEEFTPKDFNHKFAKSGLDKH
jgi:hypothetical protein